MAGEGTPAEHAGHRRHQAALRRGSRGGGERCSSARTPSSSGSSSPSIAGGHVLVEGVPGLAKTLAVSTLAQAVDCRFSRIQFTPDMLPGDVTGTQIFNPREGTYAVRKGPVFGNLVLADEINRAPAKVQAALLEAMQEGQVTLGEETFPLVEPFLVLATQNPIEQEGTYPLPEAQLDRFMMKLKVGYPSRDEEVRIVDRMAGAGADAPGHRGGERGGPSRRPRGRRPGVRRRQGEALRGGARRPQPGTRPRPGSRSSRTSSSSAPRCGASLALVQLAKTRALLAGRSYASPHDVKTVASGRAPPPDRDHVRGGGGGARLGRRWGRHPRPRRGALSKPDKLRGISRTSDENRWFFQASAEISPTSCCGRRSMRCDWPYSLKPLRRSVDYAFSVFQSVRPATAPSRRPRDGSW